MPLVGKVANAQSQQFTLPSTTKPPAFLTPQPKDMFLDAVAAKKARIAKAIAKEKAHQAAIKAQQAAAALKQQQLAQTVVEAPQPVVQTPQVVSGCGDNSYANYIYMHESGCDVTNTNAGGCYGIGQDCNGIVKSQCGTDYACQNAYFTNYANSRYGGWYQAYQAWLSKSWW